MKLKFIVLAMIAATVFSCKDDEEDSPAYSFKDQDASGEIANVSWTYGDGFADIWESTDESSLSIKLFLVQDEEACVAFPVVGDQVFFSVPNKVGLYVLHLDMNSGHENQTATLLDTEETMNYIASEGAIEILSITDTEVTGRIDASQDDENFVNGNFTVTICK